MKKYIKIILLCTIFLGGLFITGNVEATSTESVINSSGFVIENYDVNIVVDDRNFYHIEETIDANFLQQRHGIYRYIPYRYPEIQGNTYDYSKLFIRIKNIDVGGETVSKSEQTTGGYKFLTLRLGDADKYVYGDKSYNISYDYEIGKMPGQQMIYYNIMGNMSTVIENGTFTLNLPHKVNEDSIIFYQGGVGLQNESSATYTTEELSDGTFLIKGQLNEPLGSSDYLTVLIPVGDDYFQSAVVLKSTFQTFLPLLFILVIGNLLFAFVLWYFFGRDKRMIRVIEYNPPNNLTPLEIYFIHNEIRASQSQGSLKAATSLLYYLANKGYLKIEFISDKDFKITDLKRDISGEKNHVVQFYKNLFKDGDTLNKKEMKKSFYKAPEAALANTILDPYNDTKTILYKVLILMFSLGITILMVFLVGTHYDAYDTSSIGGFTGIFLAFNCIISFVLEKASVGVIKNKYVFASVLLVIYLIYSWLIFANIGSVSLLILLLLVQFAVTLSFFIKKRKDSHIDLLGRIKGFREFLTIAKKNELEMLINENPNYFFDILPYAHVLGVSKVFSDKFKDIQMNVPEYYTGTGMNTFTYLFIYNSLFRVDRYTATSYASSVKAAQGKYGGGSFGGGGGGFGGGSSGGGFGGGGGGSW